MASKTALLTAIRSYDAPGVAAQLDADPGLAEVRDRSGRTPLQALCAVPVAGRDPAAGVAVAERLLAAGIPIDHAERREDGWADTALWQAVGRGRNGALIRYLLERGASPEHCLWAAVWNDDDATVALLLRCGASVDPVAEDETPLQYAVKLGRPAITERLLDAGADPDRQDAAGRTALHHLLRRQPSVAQVALLLERGARCDLADRDGRTAAAILARKRDPAFGALVAP